MARKILLADDSVTAQNMGRKILADAGYDVVTVNNGSAALKRIAEINPDLIVLDVYMPGYSGLEVCQRLKDAPETAHLPVLLTVGKLEPFKAEEARRVRADGHIVKPFEASELLTAITRLEDSIVPQAEAGRLRNEGNGRKAETDVSADNGWKSRLGFSSKKKKEEKETVAAGFRDFRKGKPKAEADEAAKVAEGQKEQAQAFEPVRDIPRDITPEELDVLSALAAKLNKPGTQSENIAPPAEAMPLETAETVISPAPEIVEAKFANGKFETEPHSEVRAFVVVAERDPSLQAGVQTPAPVSAAAEVAAEVPGFAVTGSSAIEIPVEHLEAVAEVSSSAADPLAGESVPHGSAELRASDVAENPPVEMLAAVSTVVVDTASLAQEPAPVDQNDEPMFALAANAVERTTHEIENQTDFAQSAEVSRECESTEAVASGTVASTEPESPREVSETQNSASQDSAGQAANPDQFPANFAHPVPLAADALAVEAHEDPAPSDEELAHALRLLTPSNGHGDPSTFPSRETLAAAGQHLAEEVARGAESGSRWMARPVALSHEEAAVSLEAEMFHAFAVGIQGRLAAGRGGEVEPLRMTGVSAIAAAVENRLAAAEFAASSSGPLETGAALAGDSAQEAPSPISAHPVAEKFAGQDNSQEKASEQAPAEEVASATFADALTQHATAAGVAAVDTPDANSQIEADESMRRNKDAKSKSAKSKAQVQTVSDAAYAAVSRDEAAMAEVPKAMAAAANGEVSAPSSSLSAATLSSSLGPDAGTIARIVESVMADLRPKIVEEIVKKLAGK